MGVLSGIFQVVVTLIPWLCLWVPSPPTLPMAVHQSRWPGGLGPSWGHPRTSVGLGWAVLGSPSPIQCPQMPRRPCASESRGLWFTQNTRNMPHSLLLFVGDLLHDPQDKGLSARTPSPLGLLSTQDTIRAPIFRVLLLARRCRGLWGPQGLLRLLASPARLCPCPSRVQYSFLVAGNRRCGEDHLLELDPAARRLNRTDGQADGQISDKYGVFPSPVQAERELSPGWGEAPQCQH